jgi:hypothetical protein
MLPTSRGRAIRQVGTVVVDESMGHALDRVGRSTEAPGQDAIGCFADGSLDLRTLSLGEARCASPATHPWPGPDDCVVGRRQRDVARCSGCAPRITRADELADSQKSFAHDRRHTLESAGGGGPYDVPPADVASAEAKAALEEMRSAGHLAGRRRVTFSSLAMSQSQRWPRHRPRVRSVTAGTPSRSRERRSPGHTGPPRAVTGLAAAMSQRGRRRSHGASDVGLRRCRSARLRQVGPS